MNDIAIKNLANAVVIQAVNDYIDALETTLYSRKYFEVNEAKAEVLRIENFFEESFIIDMVFENINPQSFLAKLKTAVLTGGEYQKLYTI